MGTICSTTYCVHNAEAVCCLTHMRVKYYYQFTRIGWDWFCSMLSTGDLKLITGKSVINH